MINPRNIDSFLRALESADEENWQWKKHLEDEYWRVKYSGFSPPCEFKISCGKCFLYFHATFGDLTIYPECRLGFYRYLLRLNEEISIAKFGIDVTGEPSLMLEWPGDGLNFGQFEMAVHLLLNYFESYYPDLQLVAQNIPVAEQVAQRELEALKVEKDISLVEA